jgi:hypothetical protein
MGMAVAAFPECCRHAVLDAPLVGRFNGIRQQLRDCFLVAYRMDPASAPDFRIIVQLIPDNYGNGLPIIHVAEVKAKFQGADVGHRVVDDNQIEVLLRQLPKGRNAAIEFVDPSPGIGDGRRD